jgi:hypothetical protein
MKKNKIRIERARGFEKMKSKNLSFQEISQDKVQLVGDLDSRD